MGMKSLLFGDIEASREKDTSPAAITILRSNRHVNEEDRLQESKACRRQI
jgi:hypothetical protein